MVDVVCEAGMDEGTVGRVEVAVYNFNFTGCTATDLVANNLISSVLAEKRVSLPASYLEILFKALGILGCGRNTITQVHSNVVLRIIDGFIYEKVDFMGNSNVREALVTMVAGVYQLLGIRFT
jgi:hypothetical protein